MPVAAAALQGTWLPGALMPHSCAKNSSISRSNQEPPPVTLNRRELLLAGAAFTLVGTGVSAALLPFSTPARADAGFMVAICGGKDKYMPIVETLFAKQEQWIVKDPVPPLEEIAKQFGFTDDQFNQCLAIQKALDAFQSVRDHAVQKLGVNATPTFFINGKKLIGDLSIDQMAKEIDPYLKTG